MHPIGYHLSVAAAVVVALALDACASCPDAGFSAPGAYTATLDSQSTTSGPTCVGVDALVTGGTLDLHFESNGTLVTHCTTWIDRAGSLSAPSYPPPAGVLGEALGFGVFTTTLASGCTGRWEANLADLDPRCPSARRPTRARARTI